MREEIGCCTNFLRQRDEYLEKRLALQEELEQVTPIPEEDLDRKSVV